jgi:surface antigen
MRAPVSRANRVVAAAAVTVLVLLVPVSPAAAARPGVVVYGYPYASQCPAAGLADAVDRWGMYTCNCTSYVAWALHANRQRTDWFVPGAMNAANWPHVARLAGLVVGRAPRRGAVAVWPRLSPPFGHVAYVSAVERDGKVDVGEYNLAGDEGVGRFLFDVRTEVSIAGAVFVYVPTRREG